MNTDNFTYSTPLYLRWSDIDELRHVNNARYLTFFEEVRIGYNRVVGEWDWRNEGFLIANAQVNFRKPLFLADNPTIWARISKIGTKSFDMEYLIFNKKGELCAEGTTIQVAIDMKTFQPVAVPEAIIAKILDYEKAGSVILK
jgi:acyl-CoA thioester hydrolase